MEFKLNETDIKFINWLAKDISKNIKISQETALDMVANSSFYRILQDDKEFTYHYSLEYWSKWIIEEYRKEE